MSTFWDKYYQKPLNEIPWQNTQADWFKELVDKGAIGDKSALDLGCGTGAKSINPLNYETPLRPPLLE